MKAKDLRNSILQLAVQGKLVPQDPNDEPASVLLDRIRAERAKLIKDKKIRAPKGGESVIYRASDGSHYEKRGKGDPVCIDGEIPFEIPESWAWTRLESCCRAVIDCPHSTPSYLADDTGFYAIDTNCMGEAWNQTGLRYLSKASYEKRVSRYAPRPGDLVLSREGSIGRSVILKQENVCLGQRVMVLGFFEDGLLNRYCQLVLTSPYAWTLYMAANIGTGVKHVNVSMIKDIPIPLPPRSEQVRIIEMIESLQPHVNEYGAFEDARERLDAELPELLRKSILQLAVQGKLVEHDPADEPASVLLERIRVERAKLIKAGKLKAPKGGESFIYRASDGSYYEKHGKGEAVCIDDEIPFEIPENWAWARIRDFGFFSSGKTPSKHDRSLYDGDHLWVTSKDMKSFKIAQTGITLSDKGAAGLNTYPVGTMLFVVRSGILKRFLPIALLDKPATVNQDIKALTLYYPPIAVGLAYFIKAFEPYILEDLTKSVTTVDSLRFEEFQNMLIPIPPEAEWGRIVVHLDIALGDVITNQ